MSCRASDVGDGLRQREVAPQHGNSLCFSIMNGVIEIGLLVVDQSENIQLNRVSRHGDRICRAIIKLEKIRELFYASNSEDITIFLLV